MTSCKSDPFGDLNEPLTYEEVANVYSKLKPGLSGVLIDYEPVRFAGPILQNFLLELCNEFFGKSSVCESLKVGTILPFFKDKGVKANNKDNYQGITLFPTLCKIYEMVLLNRLEKYADRTFKLRSKFTIQYNMAKSSTKIGFTADFRIRSV